MPPPRSASRSLPTTCGWRKASGASTSTCTSPSPEQPGEEAGPGEEAAQTKKARSSKRGSKETKGTPIDVDLRCRLTTAKGWIETEVDVLHLTDEPHPADRPRRQRPADHALRPGDPRLRVRDRHAGAPRDRAPPVRRRMGLRRPGARGDERITLRVDVDGLKTVALANDHGPIDRVEAVPRLRLGPARRQRAGDRLEGGVPEGADSVTVNAMYDPRRSPTAPIRR